MVSEVLFVVAFVLFDFAGSHLDALPVTVTDILLGVNMLKNNNHFVEKPAMVQRGWCSIGGSRKPLDARRRLQRFLRFCFHVV
jgi:hypothetical protein